MPKPLDVSHRKEFLKQVNADTLQDVNLCYQCGKCSSGCPVAEEMDISPSRIIHAIRLGQKDMVANSKAIWLCASCETCTTRCPHGVDIAGAMDAAKRAVFSEGLSPSDNKVPSMHKSFLESVRMFGRVYELGMIGMFKLRTLNFLGDAGLGIKMFIRGKLALLPTPADAAGVREIFSKVKKIEGKK